MRKSSLLNATVLAASLVAAVGTLSGSGPELDPLAADLQARMDRLRSLRGRFTQKLESGSLGRPKAESGTFFLKKPAMMRWEYVRPEKKLAVSDGRVTWLYLPEDREAHRGMMDDLEQGGGAALLLAGRLRIDRDFDVRRLSAEETAALGPQEVARPAVLELLPRKPASDYERILLIVDAESVEIRRLVLIDALGDRMIFDLRDLVENPDLPDSLFHFVPPAGVEILEAP